MAELCLTAVQQDGSALGYVPKALQAQVKKAAGIHRAVYGRKAGGLNLKRIRN
jgi:hypothetical protein